MGFFFQQNSDKPRNLMTSSVNPESWGKMTSATWHPQQEARKVLPYVSRDDLSIILEMKTYRGDISLAILKEKRRFIKEKGWQRSPPKTHTLTHTNSVAVFPEALPQKVSFSSPCENFHNIKRRKRRQRPLLITQWGRFSDHLTRSFIKTKVRLSKNKTKKDSMLFELL